MSICTRIFQAQRGHRNSSSRGSRVTKAPSRNIDPEVIQHKPIGRSLDFVQDLVHKKESLARAVERMHFPIGPWNTYEEAFDELEKYALDHTTPCDVDTFGSFKLVMKGE